MKILDNIRKKIGKKLLTQSLNQRRRVKAINFASATSVAIIYREKGESFYILIKQYVKYLREEHGIREVMALSYIDDKKGLPHYHKHKLRYDFFTKADLNWKYEPVSDPAQKFADKEYDILIDFERESCLPLQFVLAKSKARFKVGIYDEKKEDFYDLMLQIPKEDTFDKYIQELNHYLNIINTGNARA